MVQAIKKSGETESTLGALTSHPTRVKSYVILTERVASPNEIAREIKSTVGHVSYHVRKLERMGLIELVEEKPVRGANEHFYRATKRPYASDKAVEEMSPEERDNLTRVTLQLHFTDVARAREAGTFDARTNRWLVRLPGPVDPEGFEELAALHEEGYKRKLDILAKSADRIATKKTESIPIVDTSMFFEMPAKPKPAG